VIIEFFRPDQPKIAGLGISYTMIFAALMAIAGIILLMARYKAIHLKFAENWEDAYQPRGPVEQMSENIPAESGEEDDDLGEEKQPSLAHRTPTPEEQAEAARIRMDKLLGRRTAKTPPAKKSS
jgi:hypothetical protein